MVFIDESGLLLTPLVRRTLAPKGQTPILEHQGRHHHKVSLMAALTISPRGRHLGLYFSSLIDDHFETVASAWFVRQLLKHLRGRVIIIWDRGNNHRGPDIRKLQADFARLTLERLPAYAAELNPVEQTWSWLKWSQLSNFAPNDSKELDTRAFLELDAIRKDQARLSSFWRGSELPLPRALAA